MRSATSDDVFVNCPFDTEYHATFEAIVFAIFACGFRARSVRELDDHGENRFEKIFNIIGQCRYGIHDLSRTELDADTQLPRFNMPLELGCFLAAKRFGDEEQRRKRTLIFDVEQYRYQKFISDLSGMDIAAHAGQPVTAVARVRDWLANVSRRRIASAGRIVSAYERFAKSLTERCEAEAFDRDRIPYVDFERMVAEWLLEAPEDE